MPLEQYHLPKTDLERQKYAAQVGVDGYNLLADIYATSAPVWLRLIPAVQILRRMWIQQFYLTAGNLKWRNEQEGIPDSAELINSPYDIDAHYSKQGASSWVGYKIHLTETCVEDSPHLITNVETTPATTFDGKLTPIIHSHLKKRNMLPQLHLADNGFVDSDLIVNSQKEFGLSLLGPTRRDYRWQAQAGKGFDASNFNIDWENQCAICPTKKISSSWTPAQDDQKNSVIKIKFSRKDCRPCPSRIDCTRAKSERRSITIRPLEQYVQLQAHRVGKTTPEFTKQYAKRAGIEGTISQGVRTFALRHSRYIGLPKTHLQHIITAAAINFVRISDWLAGHSPAQTRLSAFAKLMKPPKAA